MLVDEHNGNILALFGEPVKGTFDCGVLSFGIDDEEVLLRVWSRGDVLGGGSASGAQTSGWTGQMAYAYSCEEEPCAGILQQWLERIIVEVLL